MSGKIANGVGGGHAPSTYGLGPPMGATQGHIYGIFPITQVHSCTLRANTHLL